ncbi:MAG: lysylphosphatidylglycerol synthase domain-containing protein [Dehalococcoidia bacterium]
MTGRRAALGVLGSLAVLLVLARFVEPSRVVEAAGRVAEDPLALLVMVVAYTGAFGLRALAWALVAPGGVPVGRLFSILQASFVLNHALPVKAGEVLRPALAERAGMSLRAAIGSTVVARLLDVAGLLVTAAVAGAITATVTPPSLPPGTSRWVVAVGVLAVAGVFTVLVVAMRAPTLVARARALAGAVVAPARALRPARVAAGAALATVAWVLEAAVILGAARLLGIELSVPLAVAATTVAVAFQVVQVTPGGLGVYEASMAGTLMLHGMPAEDAVALAVLTHALKFAYAFTLGVAFALPAFVSAIRARRGERAHAGTLEVVAARAWNVLNEGKPFTPVFTLAVVAILVASRAGEPGVLARYGLGLLAAAPLALVWWAYDFPLRLRAGLWVALGAWIVLFGVTSVAAALWVVGLFFLFTVVLWGTVYYHLRIGTPWTNFTRFFRLVLENPDPTSGNTLEQLPKVLLLVWAVERVASMPEATTVLGVEAFVLACAVGALLIHQWWFTWVPALPQPGLEPPPTGERVARRVIVIAIDGCRADRLREARTPHLDRLRREGTEFTRVATVYPARTVTAFASMLTGVGPRVHGMHSNFVPRLGVRCESVFDVLRASGMRGAIVGIAHLLDAFGDDVRAVSAVAPNDEIDAALTARAREVLEQEDPELLVLQLLSVDQAGHSRGSYHREYLDRIEATDAAIGEFLGWCEARGYLRDATVLVTSDHGQGIGIGGHGHMSPPEIDVPCIWWGAGVDAGVRIEERRFLPEVAASVCGLLGLRAPASAVGRVLVPVQPPPAVAPTVFVLPARNEAENIGSVLASIQRLAIPAVEVVVVDDGSTDETAAIAERAGARVVAHERSRGLGAALRTGLAAARDRRPAAVVYLDADGEYDPADAEALLAPIRRGEADYVLGSRVLGARIAGAAPAMTRSRRAANRLFSVALSVLCGRVIADGQTGMRAFSPRAVEVAEIIHDYNYAQVLTLDLLRKGMRVAEAPISYRRRTRGASFVTAEYLWRVPLGVAREVLRG